VIAGKMAAAGRDAFALKLDSTGAFVWVRQITTPRADRDTGRGSITVDAGRNVYLATVADMEADQGLLGHGVARVTKLDPGDGVLWSRQSVKISGSFMPPVATAPPPERGRAFR
jgi:hypothetical protein